MELPDKVQLPWKRFIGGIRTTDLQPADVKRLEDVKRAARLADFKFDAASLRQTLETTGFKRAQLEQIAGVLLG